LAALLRLAALAGLTNLGVLSSGELLRVRCALSTPGDSFDGDKRPVNPACEEVGMVFANGIRERQHSNTRATIRGTTEAAKGCRKLRNRYSSTIETKKKVYEKARARRRRRPPLFSEEHSFTPKSTCVCLCFNRFDPSSEVSYIYNMKFSLSSGRKVKKHMFLSVAGSMYDGVA